MGKFIRYSGLVLLAVVLGAFQNCAKQGAFTGLDAIPSDWSEEGSNEEMWGIRSTTSPVYMNCFDNEVQVGGLCNDGDAPVNRMTFRYSLNNQIIESASSFIEQACQNGRWALRLPRPVNMPIAIGSVAILDVYFTLEVLDSKTGEFKAAAQSSPMELQVAGSPCPP